MILLIDDCRPLGQDPTKFPVQVTTNNAAKCVLLLSLFLHSSIVETENTMLQLQFGSRILKQASAPCFTTLQVLRVNLKFLLVFDLNNFRFTQSFDGGSFLLDLLFFVLLDLRLECFKWLIHSVTFNWSCLGQTGRNGSRIVISQCGNK